MHIDVNSAFLSWQAAYNIQKGEKLDLRTVPSIVGGSQSERRGIVLAKSTPAKIYGIETGEVVWKAQQKCPNLIIVPANYQLYMKCSDAMFSILKEHFAIVQRFSIDECFLDYTGMEGNYGPPIEYAHKIKDLIKQELGFTVNVGIGPNKLLAKMAGELKKPDQVLTLLNQREVKEKMWPLDIRELFMCGAATERKLKSLEINTIGDLATCDPEFLKYKLKSHGMLIWQYANGLDTSPVRQGYNLLMKGIGNSTTIKFDVEDFKTAYKVLLSLTESVAARLRKARGVAGLVAIEIRTSELDTYSHQRKLFVRTNVTNEIYSYAVELFNESWKGEKIRHLGIRVSDLASDEFQQATFFDEYTTKKQALDKAIDDIRNRYGRSAIKRAVFADGVFSGMTGGQDADDYPAISSIL